jgi:hypothetical protein
MFTPFVYFTSFIYFVNNIPANSNIIAPNVPAVYDVLRLRIRALRSNDPCPKCGGEKPHKGALRRMGFFVARAAQRAARHIQSC